METPERIWFLLSRNLSGDATEQDKEELNDLIQQYPELMQQYDMLHQLWSVNAPASEEPVTSDKLNRILLLAEAETAVGETTTPVIRIKKQRRLYWAVAAILVLAASAWLLVTWNNKRQALAANEVVAPKGSKTRTILPDGSTVWLNAGSRIVYANFNGPEREITLEGEAYFDVVSVISPATHQKKPFIVHAGTIDIRVLGTAFNVKSYPEERTIETTLIRGLVKITRKGDTKGEPVFLHPNEKIVLPTSSTDGGNTNEPAIATNQSAIKQIIHIDSTIKESEHIETAWVYNRLEFRGDNFEQLAQKLERWYNIKVYFEDPAARQLVFNGSLQNETVEQAFTALKEAVPFNVRIVNNEVFIKSTK
ncbi:MULTISPECIES: FecR family protein [Niastella]|uniref:FecR family protein n=1 Tax=Niastella soli TaxID=2821487 RepID=A0ABS3YLN5_9BACT|nr:FecR domain-containing protein [Niastella soli]MBO9198785.1 FecR family protein [Niastella soli]